MTYFFLEAVLCAPFRNRSVDMQLLFANAVNWEPAAWVILGIAGAFGLLATISPRRFTAVATRGGQWIDSSKVLAPLDKQFNIDSYVLPFSRVLGVAVLAAVVLAGYIINRY
jgi:hypothetical protein